MNPLIQFKRISLPLFVITMLVRFALLPSAQAVTPAPDGGYGGLNTAEGQGALLSLTSGIWNTAFGGNALRSNKTGSANTAVGLNALFFNTGGFNVAIGGQTMQTNSTGANNNAVGYQALFKNSNGSNNTAVGLQALFSNGSGSNNTAIGDSALFACTGNSNTALGNNAGSNLVGGEGNIYIGARVQAGVPGEFEFIRIGNDTAFTNVYDTFIAGIYGRAPGPSPLTVMCGSDGKLNAIPSSRRFKHDIKPIDKASEAILALKPVSFRYNNDSTDTPWLGLIAEDVAQVNENLIVRDKEGKPFGVRYDQVSAMLLNEFLKEHKRVEALQATVAQQQKSMEVLTAQLKEQAAQIQKVSAELELSKPAPQTVLNSQ